MTLQEVSAVFDMNTTNTTTNTTNTNTMIASGTTGGTAWSGSLVGTPSSISKHIHSWMSVQYN
jgi:hypothetical protein